MCMCVCVFAVPLMARVSQPSFNILSYDIEPLCVQGHTVTITFIPMVSSSRTIALGSGLQCNVSCTCKFPYPQLALSDARTIAHSDLACLPVGARQTPRRARRNLGLPKKKFFRLLLLISTCQYSGSKCQSPCTFQCSQSITITSTGTLRL